MKKNQEPEQLASIAISKDEIAGRQRPVGRVRTSGTEPASGAPKLLWILTIFSILLSVGILVHLQQSKIQSDKQLAALTVLQQRLSSTDEQSNLSVGAIKILLKEQDNEIRKLWDVAYKRNKNNIAKNTSGLAAQKKSLSQFSAKVSQLDKNAQALKSSISAKIKQSEQAQSSNIQTIKNQVLEVELKIDKTMKGIPDNLSKTLSDHAKGITAMDKTRLQLLKKINGLEAEIKQLKGSTAKPTGA
jgi:archaellum component FlaC